MEFKEPSEKIVALRKKFKMKQYDFETENFTRGYLGLIESKRRKLTKAASDIIVKRFRDKITELGLHMEIDDNYFLRTPKEDAIKYCREKLKYGEELTEEELIEICNICEMFELRDIEIETYILRGKIYYYQGDYNRAYIYFLKAQTFISSDIKDDLKASVYNKLGNVKIMTLDYSGALEYYKMSYEFYKMTEDQYSMSMCEYNLALCSRKLGKYEAAIRYIEETTIDSKKFFTQYVHINILKAICLENIGKIDDAIQVYMDILNFIKYRHDGESNGLLPLGQRLSQDEKSIMSTVYVNIGDAYLHKKDSAKALDNFDEAEKFDPNIDEKGHVSMEKARIFIDNKQYELAESYAEIGFEKARQFNDCEYILRSQNILFKCYEHTKDREKMKLILEDTSSIFIEMGAYESAVDTINKLIIIYNKENDNKNIARCGENIKQIFESIKNNKEEKL